MYHFIVNTIGTIDDLIENLTKTNEYLNKLKNEIWNNFLLVNECNEYTIKDVVSFYNTGADAIQKAPITDKKTNCKCVRVGDFTNNRTYNYWAYCDSSDDVISQYILKKGDVLITRTASLGYCKFINKNLNAIYNNGIIRIKANEEYIKPILLGQICSTKDFKNYISQIEGGSSTRPNMKINYLLNYKFKVPKIDNQIEISKTLSDIENIMQLNEDKLNNLIITKQSYLKKFFS